MNAWSPGLASCKQYSRDGYESTILLVESDSSNARIFRTSSSAKDASSLAADGDLFLERFRRRKQQSKYRASARRQLLPPNDTLSEVDFVKAVLDALRYDAANNRYGVESSGTDVSYDSGPSVLLRSSTPEWSDVIRRFVGVAPIKHGVDQEEYFESVASALASALGRVDNQFNILLGQPPAPKYVASFPTDPVEQDEDAAWVECRLRDAESDELLVVSGWDLKRREEDGAWLIDGLDWQDFRDGFRPGIGREEWERICG